jgi:NADPH:quinone reductase
MKALRFYEFGSLSNLKLEELPDPSPRQGEVLVRVLAAAINPSDVKNVQGKMEGTVLPRTPGRDFAGVVVEGPANFHGAEVWGTGGDIGYTRDGSHAEYLVLPVDAVALKPANLSFEQAACAGLNFVTAYEGLVVRARAQAGETVMVTGARGGVGSAVLGLGQALGAKLIAVDRKPLDPSVFEDVKLLGYVDSSEPDFSQTVRQLTGGKGVDIVYDCVGGELFEPVMSTLGDRGRQIAITSVGTRRVSFDLLHFYHRELTLLGVDSRAFTVSDSAKLLELMVPQFVAGLLKPAKIAKRGSLASAQEFYSYVDGGGAGKAVFVLEPRG